MVHFCSQITLIRNFGAPSHGAGATGATLRHFKKIRSGSGQILTGFGRI